VTDADGKSLELFQAIPDGSYTASYVENGEPYLSNECYIDGFRCLAEEARFGGIVVQTA
jgi:hypothetical protein